MRDTFVQELSALLKDFRLELGVSARAAERFTFFVLW